MEPCGSGSLHARSRVMLHLNSHSSRETTSNSSTGNTAPAAASNADTRQLSCPNISSDEQSQHVKRKKIIHVRPLMLYLMERFQKLCDAQEGPFTRSLDIYGIRIWYYIRLHLTWASWRKGDLPLLSVAPASQRRTNNWQLFQTVLQVACAGMSFIRVYPPFLGVQPLGQPCSHPLWLQIRLLQLNLRLWEVWKRAQICA